MSNIKYNIKMSRNRAGMLNTDQTQDSPQSHKPGNTNQTLNQTQELNKNQNYDNNSQNTTNQGGFIDQNTTIMGPMQITAGEKMGVLPTIDQMVQKDDMNRTAMPQDKQKLGIQINQKNLHGGAHPDRRTLIVNQMAADIGKYELDEVGNPIDYFNVYKRKMAELAHSKFDQEKDHQFFNYLDRLVNAEEYRKRERIDGLGILREFVTDHVSLTYVKKRNEQIKRWEDAKRERIEQGLPGDPPEQDASMLRAQLDAMNARAVKRVLPQKTFVPEIEEPEQQQKGSNKNYIIKQKFGQNRNFRPPWQDPNPVKYGGKYGMQHMKSMIDTGYQRGKAEHYRRMEMERKSKMTQEEIEEEEAYMEEQRLIAEQNRAKIQDLSDEKVHNVDVPLAPNDRSFLIQPEKKSLLARMPSLFNGVQMSPHGSQDNQGSSAFDEANSQVQDGVNPSNSNTSFMVQQHGAFGKRSQSMAAPLMISPSSAMRNQEYQDVFSLPTNRNLDDDESRVRLENYKTMLRHQGSSKHLLTKMQSQQQSILSMQFQNDQKYASNLDNLKYAVHDANNSVLNPPIRDKYDHKSFKADEDIESTVKLSFALEELRSKGPMKVKAGPKVIYKLRHGKNQSPSPMVNDIKLFENLTKDVRRQNTSRRQLSEVPSQYGLRNNPSAATMQPSSHADIPLFWDFPYQVIIAIDGCKLTDKSTKSIKLNLSAFIRKYQIEPPKFIAKLPKQFIESQNTFYERAYMELLEHCSTMLDTRTKDQKKYMKKTEFQTMFNIDGIKLQTINDIEAFLKSRQQQPDLTINKQKKALFISPSAASSVQEEELPPPLLLVSISGHFQGVQSKKSTNTVTDLRQDHSNEVKSMINQQRAHWGSKQILNWIESNVESGRSEAYNMESIIQKDTNEVYQNTNNEYRARIARKLGGKSTQENMAPVYMGGGLKNSNSFLLPIVEEGVINNVRKRFGSIIDQTEHQRQLTQMNMLNLSFNTSKQKDDNGQGIYGSESHLKLNQSPSKMSFLSQRNDNWNDEFINRVDQLKKQYIRNQVNSKTDRNHHISPDKKNFGQLSQASIGKVQFKVEQSPVTGSLKKIVGNFNIQADLSQVSLTKKKPKHISKNIPHLNLPKKGHQRKQLSFDEVTALSEQLKLTSSQIYELRTQYEVLKEMGEEEENEDLQVLGGNSQRPENEDKELQSLLEGIPAPAFVRSFGPLKQAHKSVQGKILSAFGVKNTRACVINWDLYLKMVSVLQFHTASQETYIDFWLNFFNLYNLPELPLAQMLRNVELLARGCYTLTPTLVSESFAKNFLDILKNNNLITGPLNESVDMILFKQMLNKGELDIEPLNKCLMQDIEIEEMIKNDTPQIKFDDNQSIQQLVE